MIHVRKKFCLSYINWDNIVASFFRIPEDLDIVEGVDQISKYGEDGLEVKSPHQEDIISSEESETESPAEGAEAVIILREKEKTTLSKYRNSDSLRLIIADQIQSGLQDLDQEEQELEERGLQVEKDLRSMTSQGM
mgnify:CR=1 FL=1